MLVCRKASVEGATNVLSVFEVLEQLTIPLDAPLAPGAMNVIPFEFDVVTLWERADAALGERLDARFRLVGPQGQELVGTSTLAVDLTGYLRARTIANIGGWPYAGPGVYHAVAEVNRDGAWHAAADFPITVFGPALPVPAAPGSPLSGP